MIKTAELDRNQNYLLGSHPHGVLCSGAFSSFATDAGGFSSMFPGIEEKAINIKYLPFNLQCITNRVVIKYMISK